MQKHKLQNSGSSSGIAARIVGAVAAYFGFQFLVSGIAILSVSGVGIVFILLGAVVLGLGVSKLIGGGKKKPTADPRTFGAAPKARVNRGGRTKKTYQRPSYKPETHRPAEDCDHSPVHPRDRELAQLESLFDAGMYERHEYDKKKRQILERYR